VKLIAKMDGGISLITPQ